MLALIKLLIYNILLLHNLNRAFAYFQHINPLRKCLSFENKNKS